MMTAIDGALVRIDLERSDLGATMSRMEYTINNLSNISVNTQAARSRINDSDIAKETSELTKAQVLNQAAQAMLSQANRSSQAILGLLSDL
jgi:flagellin